MKRRQAVADQGAGSVRILVYEPGMTEIGQAAGVKALVADFFVGLQRLPDSGSGPMGVPQSQIRQSKVKRPRHADHGEQLRRAEPRS